MNRKNKTLTAVLLIILVIGLGIASVLVASRVGREQAVAPTAPTSIPMASESAWVGSTECSLSFDQCDRVDAKWTDFSACSKTCGGGEMTRTCTPGSCGGDTTCAELDGGDATRACNTQACPVASISCKKTAVKDDSENVIQTVSKNQTFDYILEVINSSTVAASAVQVTDILTGTNQNWLSFVSATSPCTFNSETKTVSCTVDVPAGQTKKLNIKVKASADPVNGQSIRNLAKTVYAGKTSECTNTLDVSTIVSCNVTCTSNSECSNGLSCVNNSCRNVQCVEETDCVCVIPTEAPVVTEPPATRAPVVKSQCSESCSANSDCVSGLSCSDGMCRKPACLDEVDCTCPVAESAPQPTALPEAGIISIPGIAAFGGGLFLAIVGILLAL